MIHLGKIKAYTFLLSAITADSGSEPAAGGPHGPQQTALHHAGAEGGSAGEEPAQSSADGGSGGAAALQEVRGFTLSKVKE